MATEIPATMRALVTQADKTAKVVEVPVPEIADDEVLVKVVAVAQNPTDWKRMSPSHMILPPSVANALFAQTPSA